MVFCILEDIVKVRLRLYRAHWTVEGSLSGRTAQSDHARRGDDPPVEDVRGMLS